MTFKCKNLGSYLRKSRKNLNLSQHEVAKVFGYSSPQFVSNWERATCSAPLKVLRKLVKLYQLDPNTLGEFILRDVHKELEKTLKQKNKEKKKR